MEGLLDANAERAKALLKEAGYDGTPVVLMHSTDLAVLANLARTVARLAVLSQPFIPVAAQTIWSLFPPLPPVAQFRFADLGALDVSGIQVQKPPILFPKPRLAAA